MWHLAYQDIPDNATEIVTELSKNNTLAEMMAMAFVIAMLGVPLFAVYLIAKVIRTPKHPPPVEDDGDKINTAVIMAMIKSNENESKQRHKEVMLLTMGIDSTKNELLQKADDITIASGESQQSVRASLDTTTAAIETQNESVKNMNQQFQTLEKAIRDVLDKVEGGMSLDEDTKNEIIAEVSKNISTTVHDCMEKAIKTATQESSAIPVDKPNEEKTNDGQSTKHSRRLDNTISSDNDPGSGPSGSDSKTVST